MLHLETGEWVTVGMRMETLRDVWIGVTVPSLKHIAMIKDVGAIASHSLAKRCNGKYEVCVMLSDRFSSQGTSVLTELTTLS